MSRYRLLPAPVQEAVLRDHCGPRPVRLEPRRRAARPLAPRPEARAGLPGAVPAAHRRAGGEGQAALHEPAVLGVRARGCELAGEPTALRVHGLRFRLPCGRERGRQHRGGARRDCAGRLPGCRAGEPRTSPACLLNRTWVAGIPRRGAGGGCQICGPFPGPWPPLPPSAAPMGTANPMPANASSPSGAAIETTMPMT